MNHKTTYLSNNISTVELSDNKKIFVNIDNYGFHVINNSDIGQLPSLQSVVNVIKKDANTYAMPSKYRNEVIQLLTSTNHNDFTSRLDGVLTTLKSIISIKCSFKYLYTRLIVRLWVDGFILFPGGFLKGGNNISAVDELFPNFNFPPNIHWGDLQQLLDAFDKSATRFQTDESNGRSDRILRRFLCCFGPISKSSDITQAVVDAMIVNVPEQGRYKSNIRDALNKVLDVQHFQNNGVTINIPPEFYGNTFEFEASYNAASKMSRSFRKADGIVIPDINFNRSDNFIESIKSFILDDVSLSKWHKQVTGWLSSLTGLKSTRNHIIIARKFLEWLLLNPDAPREPELFFMRSNHDMNVMIDVFSKNCNCTTTRQSHLAYASNMFDWILKHCCTEETDGHYYLIPGFKNPIPKEFIPQQNVLAGETAREVMPWSLVEICKQIIIENDFEWCRDKKRFAEDHFHHRDPDTGQTEVVWNPVRGMTILSMLNVPLRMYQVRMLDSGEGDEVRYDINTGEWLENVGTCAHHWSKTKAKPFNRGATAQVRDNRTGKIYPGLRISTNKTKLRGKNFYEKGYVIPWGKPEMLQIFARLYEFQQKYNPVQTPLPYSQTMEEDMPTGDVLARIPDRFYLFRDINSKYITAAPVTKGRVRSFWNKLMVELEIRLELLGIKDGEDKFMIFDSDGNSIYDPHGLRVSGLTALAENGVDYHILSKFVAGHSKILMTLYYTKLSVSYINDKLTEATYRVEANAQTNLRQYLKSKTYDRAKSVLVAHTDYAPRQLAETSSGTWSFMDHGVCPNGCARCHDGSIIPIIDQKDRKTFGQANDCAACRFFLTGPSFLQGLRAKYNERWMYADDARLQIMRVQEEKQQIMHERAESERQGTVFTKHREIVLATNNYHDALKKFNDNSDIINNYHCLIQQTIALIQKMDTDKSNRGTDEHSFALIHQHEDIGAYLEEVTDFDFFDSISQSATFYKSVNPSLASLRRNTLFNAFLLRNNLRPLLDVPEDVASKAITEASNLMRKRFGTETLNRLIEGDKMLLELKTENTSMIDRELESAISDAIGRPYFLTGAGNGLIAAPNQLAITALGVS